MAFSRYPQQASKTEQVCQLLYEIALEKGPNSKLPPTRDLVELLQTSQTTLFEALNILEEQDILLRKLGSGIFVSHKLYRKNICVLLYPHLFLQKNSSPFWGILWGLLAREAEKRSVQRDEHYLFHLLFQPSENDKDIPEDIRKLIQQKRLHGAITIGSNVHTYTWLEEQQIPCVAFAGWSKWQVLFDDQEATRLALPHLIQQGCLTPACWYSVDVHSNYSCQTELVRTCVEQAGGSFDPTLVHSVATLFPDIEDLAAISYQEQGYRIAHEIFGNPQRTKPDGLYINDDMMTWGALVAFQELGMKVGTDIKLASSANRGSPTLFGYTEKMTLLEYDPDQLVQALFALLDVVIENPEHEACLLQIPPTLHPA